MEEVVLEVKDLKKSYKKNEVLKGVSFSVFKGQVFSLLGSNGAGKTTAVKILATLLRPDYGKISVCGYDLVKEAHKVRECISLTGQYASVDENLTGHENINLIGKLLRLQNIKAKSAELLEMFELTSAANRRVKTYSGGMRRKLDLAMSLLGEPKIIFLDEPTSGLDPQSRLSLWKTIQNLRAKGITIFLTTQYLDEAENLSDFVAVLNEGVIAASGTVEEMKKLLPSRIVEIGFLETESLEKAMKILKKYNPHRIADMQAISINIDEGLNIITEVLNCLKTSKINVSRFEKKSASLQEVFLSLVKGGRTDEKN